MLCALALRRADGVGQNFAQQIASTVRVADLPELLGQLELARASDRSPSTLSAIGRSTSVEAQARASRFSRSWLRRRIEVERDDRTGRRPSGSSALVRRVRRQRGSESACGSRSCGVWNAVHVRGARLSARRPSSRARLRVDGVPRFGIVRDRGRGRCRCCRRCEAHRPASCRTAKAPASPTAALCSRRAARRTRPPACTASGGRAARLGTAGCPASIVGAEFLCLRPVFAFAAGQRIRAGLRATRSPWCRGAWRRPRAAWCGSPCGPGCCASPP